MFPAPGEPVTGRTTSVQHEILTSDARPVCCGPRRLALAGLRTEQTCVQEMLLGGQIELSDSPWGSPVVLVTKTDGSTRFCVDYRQWNSLTTKELMTRCGCWVINSGSQCWTSLVGIGKWPCPRKQSGRRHLLRTRGCSNSG